MAADFDSHVNESRHPSGIYADPFTFVAADGLTLKRRKGGRAINTVVLASIGLNGDVRR